MGGLAIFFTIPKEIAILMEQGCSLKVVQPSHLLKTANK